MSIVSQGLSFLFIQDERIRGMEQSLRDERNEEENPSPRLRAGLSSGLPKHELRDAVQQVLTTKLKKIQLQ